MVMNRDRVAVIMAVYMGDKAEYCKLAIDSILGQTFTNVRLLIGVDGSIKEEVGSLLALYESMSNVEIIHYQENRGLAAVLNDLLDVVFKQGFEYVTRMDADDISFLDRIEKQYKFLNENPEVDVVGGAIQDIDELGNKVGKIVRYPITNDECREFFAKRDPHAHPSVMYRKRLFDKIGHKYRTDAPLYEDTMLWLDAFTHGAVQANLSDVVLYYRTTQSLFKQRRGGWVYAKEQLANRLQIKRELGYGLSSSLYAFARFLMLICPVCIKRLAYRLLR